MCLFLSPCRAPQRSGINSSDVEVLIVANVTEEDAGEYTCQVSNYLGQVNQSGWLTVLPGKTLGRDAGVLPPLFWVVVVILGYLLNRCGVFCFYWWIFSWWPQLPCQSVMETSHRSPLATDFLFFRFGSVLLFPVRFSLFSILSPGDKTVACFPCFFSCVCMDPWGSIGLTRLGNRAQRCLFILMVSTFKRDIYHLCNV